MHPSQPESIPSTMLTLVTWNVLIDITRTEAGKITSQSLRLPSLVATLQNLREQIGTELDVVAIQEAHEKNGQHNGENLAKALEYGTGQWIEHNKKPHRGSRTGRKGEYVGLFGARIKDATPVELGDNRRAVLSRVGKTAIVNIHPRSGFSNRDLQDKQVKVALAEIEESESAVLMGDFNQLRRDKARRAIEAAGFKSVFRVIGKRQPKTWPSPAYRKPMYGSAHILLPSVNWDDIYIRGLAVHHAGVFTGESDHAGLWAKVETET